MAKAKDTPKESDKPEGWVDPEDTVQQSTAGTEGTEGKAQPQTVDEEREEHNRRRQETMSQQPQEDSSEAS